MKEIFSRPTIASLGGFIDSAAKADFVSIPKAEAKRYYRLSSSQQRMYFLYEFDRHSLVYNMPEVIRLEGQVDRFRIEKVFEALIARHGSFRTRFEVVGEEVMQEVVAEAGFELEYYESASLEVDSIIRSFIRPFDLQAGGLLRAGLVKLEQEGAEKDMEDEAYLLLVDMHHIISDGVSREIVREEFTALYKGLSLPALPLGYIDYAEWEQSEGEQQRISAHKAYWLEMYADPAPVLDLPTDYARPPVQSFLGHSLDFELGEAESAALLELSMQSGSSMYMVLLSIYSLLLSKLSNEEDIVVGTVLAGRDHVDLEGMIGMFVRTLALRNYPLGKDTYLEYLSTVREGTLSSFEHQSYPYEALLYAHIVTYLYVYATAA